MQRFYLYEGVKGVLVGDPQAKLGDRRFVGQRRLSYPDPALRPVELIDQYEPTQQVCAEHKMLAKAVAAAELRQLAGPVVATSYEAAAKQLAAAKPAVKVAKKVGGAE